MLVTSLQIGGAEMQVATLACLLKARNWEVAVVSLLPASGVAEALRKADIPVYSLDMKRGWPDPRAVLQLSGLVRDWKPDVVHSHMVHANLLARFTRLITPIPVLICTAHNTRETSERGGPTWYKEQLYRITDRLADHTTIICQAGYDHYTVTHAVPAHRLEVLPIGIDCEKFAPRPNRRSAVRQQLGLSDSEFAWIAVGRMVVQKDFPNMLRAFAQIRGGNWKLLIAGGGPLQAELELYARQLDIDNQVRFLGIFKDIPALHNAADGLVLSSELEGLPLAVLEASASGLPCVVTEVGGTREAVLDGVSGFVVPPHDSEGLSQALTRMMSLTPDELQRFSRAARWHALDRFEIASVVDRWESVYERFLTPRAAPLKILYVITRAERGGAQVHVQDLLGNHPTESQAVLVTGEPGYLCDWAAERNIPVRIIPNMCQPISPIRDVKALVALIRLFRCELPALVHAHTSKAGLLCRFAGALSGTPVVFTAHTWSFADGISNLQRAIALPLEHLAARGGGRIIAVSEANAKAAVANSIAEASEIAMIWNGIPDTPYRATPGSRPEITVVMVARFAPQKNQRALVEALARMQVDCEWKLVLVGSGPTRPDIESLASLLGIRDRVHFLGDRGDVAEVLASSDVFVLSTNWEGLPLSILEGMRAGLPVIATDVGGCSEAVTDGETGFLISRNDTAELSDRLERLLSSRQLLRSMGHAGRSRFERDFRLEAMLHKTWNVYEGLAPELDFTASILRLQQRVKNEMPGNLELTISEYEIAE